jgi:mannose-6-phosphate isomerase-like protein (cupin superfamily)
VDFDAPIDFVDFTIIPPGSSIGWHGHEGNEEVYFIAAGNPLVKVMNEQRRLSRGDIAVVRSEQSHELTNDTPEDVQILVFQVRLVR